MFALRTLNPGPHAEVEQLVTTHPELSPYRNEGSWSLSDIVEEVLEYPHKFSAPIVKTIPTLYAEMRRIGSREPAANDG